MPHDKARAVGGVALDHKKLLTITKLDSCGRSADPFKIPKRSLTEEDRPGPDVQAKCTRKCPKIHWSQLASNGETSQPNCHHNGSQTAACDQDGLMELDINSRQVRVVLTDVLQTEEGRRYWNSCDHDSKKKCQTELKKGVRERRSDRLVSAVEPRDRRRSSVVRNEQLSSPSTRGTRSASVQKNNTPQLKETKSPPPKRLRQLSDSLSQTKSTASAGNESSEAADRTVSPPSPETEQTEPAPEPEAVESCPVKERDSGECVSASPLRSDGANTCDDKQVPQCVTTQTPRRPTPLSLTRQRLRTAEDFGSEARSPQLHINRKKVPETPEKVGEEEGKKVHETVAAAQQNGEVKEEGGLARGSVLRLSLATPADQTETGLTDGEVPPPKSCELRSPDVESMKIPKVHTPEPIILSSEEEEEEENSRTPHLQTLEGAKVPQTPQRLVPSTVERKKTPNLYTKALVVRKQASSFVEPSLNYSPVMDLQFSALYMGGLSALSSGVLKITCDKIIISLKDLSGKEVKVFFSTAHLRKYSIWEGQLVQDSGLVKQNKTPPPSLLLLWLSEAQARRVFIDLSVIQPGSCLVEGSVCVLLCLSEPLRGIECALLASIMDIVGLRHESTELLSPLTHSESMKLLERDTYLLQLLQPKADTCSSSQEAVSAPEVPEGTATTPPSDPDVQANSVYTLCHSRTQGTYNASMATRPGPEWTPYKHRGPARRLIQFPPPPCKGALTVTTEDLECLDSGEFLNDVIIDFYLKYLLVQKAPHSSVKRSHVFSSFFYKQLTRRDNANEDSTSTPAQLRRHQRVRTWTRHVDIFDKDFLFVPVNQEAHWYLVVVCFPGMDEPQWTKREGQDSVLGGTEPCSDSTAGNETQEGSRPNSDGEKSSGETSSRPISTPAPPNCTEKTCKLKTVCKRPCILIMDSLKLSVHERIFKLLREYLQVEWEVKRGGQRDFSAERMVGSHCRVPLQDNSSDCGLYLLQYAESFLQDPVVHFDLPLRLECWFPRQQVREKREEIRDLVLHLYRFQHSSVGHDASEERTDTGSVVQ